MEKIPWHQTVVVHEHLDGRLSVRYGPHLIAQYRPEELPPPAPRRRGSPRLPVAKARRAAEKSDDPIQMLESFGMHTGGKEYRRLVAAFEGVLGATIFFGTDALSGKASLVQRCRFNFMREAQIWYTRTPDDRLRGTPH